MNTQTLAAGGGRFERGVRHQVDICWRANMTEEQIVISALGPTIGEQASKLKIKPSGMTIEQVDQMSHDLTRAHIWGLLTDTEIDRARLRLLRRAKFVAADA